MATDLQTDLLPQLLALGTDCEELPELLDVYFKGSRNPMGAHDVYYPSQGDPNLRLHYSKHGTLESAHAEAVLTVAEFESLLESLRLMIGAEQPLVDRRGFFSTMPVCGWWKYRDAFQILPVPPDAPRPEWPYAAHPFLIEFRSRSTPDWLRNALRRDNAARKLELLLNVALVGSVELPNFNPRRHKHEWVRCASSEDSGRLSEYRERGYAFRGDRSDGASFSGTDGWEPLVAVQSQQYYTRPVPRSPGSTLTVPADLETFFDDFYALPPIEQDDFLQACFWLKEAGDAPSTSSALIQAVQAIEVLTPDGNPTGICEKCNRQFKPGPTQQCRAFLDEYAPLEGGESPIHKLIYETRSGLAHGYRPLLRGDLFHYASLNPAGIAEQTIHGETVRAVRIALRNWVCRTRDRIRDISPSPTVLRS
jgi:hypothetical protein